MILTFVIIFVVIVIIFLILALELYLSRAIKLINKKLAIIEAQISGYRDYSKYLKRKDRSNITEYLNSVFGSIHQITVWQRLLTRHQRDSTNAYFTRAKEFESFLADFIPQYTKKEVKRYKEFFNDKQFDQEQLEAIVKQEDHHLVIAAAGSGKTRTLTARIAFIVKQGYKPEDILALTYTKSAAEEVQGRLTKEYGINRANIRTFHSLGLKLAKLSPNFRTGVATEKDTRRFIREGTEILCDNRDFAILYLRFAIEFRTGEPEQIEPGQTEKLYNYMRNQIYTTLNGLKVKSIAERDIANFLFLNKIKFDYEAPAKWADRDEDYKQYEPDFFLPEYGIWIEHWAVDRQGHVPEWFSSGESGDPSVRYREGMEWKRGQFKKYNRELIETYNYQYTEHTLKPQLRSQLLKNNVVLREMTVPEILAMIKTLITDTDTVYDLILSFIRKAKTNGLKIDDINTRLGNGKWSLKQETFAQMMIQIWQGYESLLQQNEMIDFNDMINLALEVVKKGDNKQRNYEHILIDEFQDITDPQLEILKCLLSSNDNSMLFCVGDSRQNIFSFAGSNMYNIFKFNKLFPYAEESKLSTNYRCPSTVVSASNQVDALNKVRVDNIAVSASKLHNPILLIEMPKDVNSYYDKWEIQNASELLRQIVNTRAKSEQIMILSRTNKRIDKLKLEFPGHESIGMEFLTIHRAKGKEADYVLLLGCIKGVNGFPSEIEDQDVLDIVQKNRDENYKLEEERRLFYVAITRCKKELFLFTSEKLKSKFVLEIEPFVSKYEVKLT
jgi:DNA helicase-4